MLHTRLLAAFCIITPTVFICWLDDQWNFGYPGFWTILLGMIAAMAGGLELSHMMQRSGCAPSRSSVAIVSLMIVASCTVPLILPAHSVQCPIGRLGSTAMAVTVGFWIILIVEMAKYRSAGSATTSAALAFFAASYIGLPLAFMGHMRLLNANRWGLMAVISIIFIVKLSDTGAFFVGKSIGRRKLAPTLSPNKTVEGAIGAVIAGCLASCIFFGVIVGIFINVDASQNVAYDIGMWVLYGGSLAMAGMIGDLAESLLKRDMQTKDSGNWIPGLGGILDVVDSVFLAAPIGYAWWATRGIGPT